MNLLEMEGCRLGGSTYVGKNRVNMYSYSKQIISVIFTKIFRLLSRKWNSLILRFSYVSNECILNGKQCGS